jgi:hypothetical protein
VDDGGFISAIFYFFWSGRLREMRLYFVKERFQGQSRERVIEAMEGVQFMLCFSRLIVVRSSEAMTNEMAYYRRCCYSSFSIRKWLCARNTVYWP